jgi:hypothetical protein
MDLILGKMLSFPKQPIHALRSIKKRERERGEKKS